MSADNGLLINKSEDQVEGHSAISGKTIYGKEVLKVGRIDANSEYRGPKLKEHPKVKLARVFASISLLASQAACIGKKGPILTSEQPTTAEIVPTLEITLTPAITSLPSYTPELTSTPEQALNICDATVEEMNQQGDITQRLPAPERWSDSQKNNIVDADGIPIFPDVVAISQNAEDAGLSVKKVAIAEQVGGYVVGLEDSEGNSVWIQDNQDRPAGRMDNNGQITQDAWDVIPAPPFGNETVWMQKENGGVCGYVVAESEREVVGKYEPVTKVWTMGEAAALAETQSAERMDWNYVSKHTDEEIFATIGVPNHEDYELEDELSADKILRNEGGQSYALFKNEEGIDLLAENLETKEVNHAIYAEYEGGVPVLLLTDEEIVKKDNGWFKLNEDYGQEDAQDRFGEAVNRGLAMTWWNQSYPGDFKPPGLLFNSLDKIPGYNRYMHFELFSRETRMEISDYMLEGFTNRLSDARKGGWPVNLQLADKHRSEFNAAKDLLIIRPKRSDKVTWASIVENIPNNTGTFAFVDSERDGSALTLELTQPSFYPTREPIKSVGGIMTKFIRYFFGSMYYAKEFVPRESAGEGEPDLTGPICEELCKPGSLYKWIEDSYKFTYGTEIWTWDSSYSFSSDTCAVNFGK